jgi:hypothetical protein
MKPSKVNEFWKIHSGTNKEMRFKIASAYFRPIDVNDDGTVVRQVDTNMKSNGKGGISNEGAPFTVGIPFPSACLEDVKMIQDTPDSLILVRLQFRLEGAEHPEYHPVDRNQL